MSSIVKGIVGVVEIALSFIPGMQWLLPIGIATLLSAGASLLAPKASSATGNHTQIAYDPIFPRQLIVGRTITAGSLAAQLTHDHLPTGGLDSDQNKNRVLEIIIALADHECDGLEYILVDGQLVGVDLEGGSSVTSWPFTLPPGINGRDPNLGWRIRYSKDPVTGLPGTDFTDKMWIKFYSGADGQAADPWLQTALGTKWPSTSVGTNVCYARVTCKYDQKVFSGIPHIQFVLRGAKLYDPRLDTTAGGSGAQRWGTPSTYAWSDNPAVISYNLCRGVYTGGNLFYGASALDVEVPFAQSVAAMNSCDEVVSLKAGGTESRYKVGGQTAVSRDAQSFLQSIAASMGGFIGTGGGTIVILPGVSQTPVMSFTDNDIMAKEAYELLPKFSFDMLKNAVSATFMDPAQNWSLSSLPVRVSSTDVTSDGGLELSDVYQFDMIQSGTQGQRVMEIMRERNRRQITLTETFSPKAFPVERGDWINYTSAQWGYSSKTFLVVGASYKPNLDTVLNLVEVDSNIFAWNPATDELAPGASNLQSASPAALPGAVQNFSVLQSGNICIFSWSDLTDLNIKGYTISYGPQGGSPGAAVVLTSASRQTAETNAGVPPGAWTFWIAGVNNAGEVGTWTSFNLTVVSANSIIKAVDGAPDWIGTKVGCIVQCNGALIPIGTKTCDNYTAWEDFNPICPDIVASATYTGTQIDLGFDASVRVYASPFATVVYGQAGAPSLSFRLDSWLTGGSDPVVFVPWNSTGFITARYLVPQLKIDTSIQCAVSDFTVTVDAPPLKQSASVAVGASPTTINFADYGLGPFHNAPLVTANPADATLTSASAYSPTQTQVTLKGFVGSTPTGGQVIVNTSGV